MGNYILLVALAAVVAFSSFLHGTRSSTMGAERRLADHSYKSITAREAALTGLNLTARKLVADASRWTDNPSAYEFRDERFKKATFTTRVLGNYGPGPIIDECAIDTVDVVSTGFPDADGSGFRNHRIEVTYVRTCAEVRRTRNWSSIMLGYDDIHWPDDTQRSEPQYDTLTVSSGVELLSYAEW